MGNAKSFEDLVVWQKARVLVRDTYSDFGVGSPGYRDFGFRDQIQRASISVMNNIAEGFERTSDVDFARFLGFAKGSCGELRSMYYPAEDLDYVSAAIAGNRRSAGRQLSAGIATLRLHLLKDTG